MGSPAWSNPKTVTEKNAGKNRKKASGVIMTHDDLKKRGSKARDFAKARRKKRNTRYVAKAFFRKKVRRKHNMNGGQQETTYVGCEAKLGSKRGTHATGTKKREK